MNGQDPIYIANYRITPEEEFSPGGFSPGGCEMLIKKEACKSREEALCNMVEIMIRNRFYIDIKHWSQTALHNLRRYIT